jgi:hypothetical protein
MTMTEKQPNDVYIAVILYESSSSSKSYESLFEESFMLVRASSLVEAKQKVHQYAEEHSSTFENEAGESITWSLKHVLDVNQVLYDVNTDGAEIYARHFRNYEAYRAFEPLLSGVDL